MKRFQPAVLLLSMLCAMPLAAAMSKAEAKKLIAEHGLPETGEGLIGMLNYSMPEGPKLVEAFITLGIRVDQPVTYDADGGVKLTRYPLNYLLIFSCKDPTVAEKAKLMLAAGADPNMTDPENDWAALAQAHACPHVIRVLLDAPKKPDVNRVDRNGNTAMHYVIIFGDDDQLESIRMLLDAGFDVKRFEKQLREDARQKPDVMAALFGKPQVATKPRGTTSSTAKTDWKALPPYADRSAAEAKKMLSQPGAATTTDEHMWTGITHREPLRLSLALQAGADIRQTRAVTGYTPLVLMAERCDLKDADVQAAIAKLLVDGGAELNGVDANGSNALILAAGDCPLGVVQVLLGAGISPHARSPKGKTALHNAISDGRADVVEVLLDAGVDPKKEPYNVKALASGKKEIEALLKKKRR